MKGRLVVAIFLVLMHGLPAELESSGEQILSRMESENGSRHDLLIQYSGSRQYTLKNARFGKQAAVGVAMKYRHPDGEKFLVLSQSGSDRLIGIINTVLESEARASVPPEHARHQITAANYRARLLGTEVVDGRNCYVLALTPRTKNRYLIVGKVWVDAESFGTVRIDGQFAASISLLLGAPRLREDFVEVNGLWLPGHVHSVTSSFLLGPTELEIVFSNYQLDTDSASASRR
ncbi:MAG: sigma-E factor regulatory protein RseB domain-containing protein [Candidatus Solibacter sp.]